MPWVARGPSTCGVVGCPICYAWAEAGSREAENAVPEQQGWYEQQRRAEYEYERRRQEWVESQFRQLYQPSPSFYSWTTNTAYFLNMAPLPPAKRPLRAKQEVARTNWAVFEARIRELQITLDAVLHAQLGANFFAMWELCNPAREVPAQEKIVEHVLIQQEQSA